MGDHQKDSVTVNCHTPSFVSVSECFLISIISSFIQVVWSFYLFFRSIKSDYLYIDSERIWKYFDLCCLYPDEFKQRCYYRWEFYKWIKGSIVNWNKHLPEYTYLTTHVVAFTLSAYTVSKVSWYYKKKRVEQIILLLYYCVFRCYKQTDLTNLTQSQKYTCIGSWYETNLENT